jgi:hypothetical protein
MSCRVGRRIHLALWPQWDWLALVASQFSCQEDFLTRHRWLAKQQEQKDSKG